MDNIKLKSVIESILFVSGEPVKLTKIVDIVKEEESNVKKVIEELAKSYVEDNRGLMIIAKKDEVQMVSSGDNTEFVEKLVKNELEGSLSVSALEVLSIIAYRSPVSKAEIEAIRGVNCSYTLRNLTMRGLVERKNNPSDTRGYIYNISFDFLKKMGIDKVENLPKYDILSKDERVSSIIEKQ